MPFRIAMLAFALAAAGPASAQTGAGDPRSADADLDRTVVEADVIEGVSDLEVTARGNAEIQRDDLSIFGDLLRYNRELGRAEGDGGVRAAARRRPLLRPAPVLQHARRHRRVREPEYLLQRDRTARGSAERLEFLGREPLPHDQRDVHDLPARSGRLAAARRRSSSSTSRRRTAKRSRRGCASSTPRSSPRRGPPSRSATGARSGILTPYYAQTSTRGFEFGTALLLEHRPRVRRDLHAGVHGEARRPAEDPGPLPRPQLHRRAQVRVPARRQGIRRLRAKACRCSTRTNFPRSTTLVIDYNRVSDDRYFVDLATQVKQLSVGNLPQEAHLTHGGSFGRRALLGAGARCRASRPCRIRWRRSCRPTTACRSSTSAPATTTSAARSTRA